MTYLIIISAEDIEITALLSNTPRDINVIIVDTLLIKITD